MTLLILTRSDDFGVDLVERYLEKEYLRLNIDKELDFSFALRPDYWEVEKDGKLVSSIDSSVIWMWKCFLSDSERDNFEQKEITYSINEIYSFHRRRRKVKGNPPYFHTLNGKIFILQIASKYFKIPETEVVYNRKTQLENDTLVAKSLSSEPFTNGKVLFTTRVSREFIDPLNIWYLQQLTEAVADVTIFIAGNDCFMYSRDRRPEGSIDWRREQADDPLAERWTKISPSGDHKMRISKFITDLQVEWGRLDFLLTSSGQLVFLEFNANGQFGFLDPTAENGLIRGICKYLENIE